MFSRAQHSKPGHGDIFAEMSPTNRTHTARRGRKISYIGSFFAIVTVFLLYRSAFTGQTNTADATWHRITSASPLGESGNKHPVEELVVRNEQIFETLVEKQSKTLAAAAAEYKHRYGRRPPPGFDKWFRMAKSRDMILVDEFDSIMASLEPFWGINPKTLQARVDRLAESGTVLQLVLNDTGLIDIVPNKTRIHQHIGLIERMLSPLPWKTVFDEVDFLVSTFDEPRVSVAAEALDLASSLAKTQRSTIDGGSPELQAADADLHVHRFAHQNIWEWLVDSCKITDPARSWEATFEDFNATDPVLTFVGNPKSFMDPCMDPQLHHYHSIWTSPSVVILSKHLVPVLSQARPTRFNDILYPSPFYVERLNEGKEQDDTSDIPWNQKLDRVYWVGTANAGWATPENWMKLNRQRMTIMTGPDSPQPVPLLTKSPGSTSDMSIWKAKTGSLWKDIAGYFHLRIAKIDWCPNPSCEVQEAYFHPAKENMIESLKSKYCLDMDGTSYSGRYYRLLRSSCAVMKQTLFEEWHDGWLVPWVHYIPISPRGDELGEVTRFLIEEPEGRVIGEKIALQGREWSKKILRQEDLGLVLLRVLMEYKRLISHHRNDLFYS